MDNIELDAYLQNLFQQDKANFLNAPPESKAIRINSLKIPENKFKTRLKSLKVEFRELPFNNHGIELLDDPLPLSHTIDFFLGYFQYQGISSQIPALALDPKPGDKVLDMAAAPGSKSTQLAALMQNTGELYLNDFSHRRLQPLNVNAQRAGVLNHIIMNLAGERYGNLFPEYFDKILVDAPCTAIGTLATNPEVADWWSLEKLQRLCVSQRQLLISAVKALRVGGEMVYSTCSVAPDENELQIQWLIENYPVEIVGSPMQNLFLEAPLLRDNHGGHLLSGLTGSIRLFPHIHNSEGFFVIKLKKTGRIVSNQDQKLTQWNNTMAWNDPVMEPELLKISEKWGIDTMIWPDFYYIKTSNRIWMMHQAIERVPVDRFQNAGLLLAENKRSGWKLTNQSVQYLNHLITAGRLTLDEGRLTDLFAQGRIPVTGLDYGYYVLEWNGAAVASVYSENDRIQLRLPHFFNLKL